MATVLLVIHLMIAAALVGVVLLQRSEGGALGIGGGGGGVMTGRGAANLLTRATAALCESRTLGCILQAHGAVHLHYRRRGVLAREGARFCSPGCAASGARLLGPAAQARPLPQRRSWHDEPLPARGGVR